MEQHKHSFGVLSLPPNDRRTKIHFLLTFNVSSPLRSWPVSVCLLIFRDEWQRCLFFSCTLADFINAAYFEGYWQWNENSGQVWEGSLRVFPVDLSFSMLLSTQLIMQGSGLFFLRTHSILPHILMAWHRSLPQSPSVWSEANWQAESRSWSAYWWSTLPVWLLLLISEDVHACAALFSENAVLKTHLH